MDGYVEHKAELRRAFCTPLCDYYLPSPLLYTKSKLSIIEFMRFSRINNSLNLRVSYVWYVKQNRVEVDISVVLKTQTECDYIFYEDGRMEDL